ncbi:MAG: TerB family tellurite resistance protein [Candidatus Limnocylindrales bacterium]
MSLFQYMFGIGRGAAPTPASAPVGDTESVRRIAARLGILPPERARFVAAFAYLLARAARVDVAITAVETAEIARLVAEVGALDAETAALVAELAGTRVEQFGATDDYLVTREFKAISTPEEREQLLRCCLVVAAADDDIDAVESWLVNRMAEELDIPRPDLNRIRASFTDKIAGLVEVRRLRGATPTDMPPASIAPRAAASSPAPAPQPAPDLPPGVRIEQVWLVEVPYTPEARERRPAFRVQHLSRLARLRAEGRIIEAGGAADFSKAVLLMRGADEAEVLAVIASDVYTSGGVWHNPTVVGYGRVVSEG